MFQVWKRTRFETERGRLRADWRRLTSQTAIADGPEPKLQIASKGVQHRSAPSQTRKLLFDPLSRWKFCSFLKQTANGRRPEAEPARLRQFGAAFFISVSQVFSLSAFRPFELTSNGPVLPCKTVINVTDSAVRQLKSLLAESTETAAKGLRVEIAKGGCSGLQYEMSLDEPKQGDEVVEREGVRFFVSPDSSSYLDGATLDFKGGLTGTGFQIVNPNATRTCGCGTSFEAAPRA